MGDVYMLNGEILHGFPNHAKNIIFNNTGTTLNSTNTEDAIKEVNSKLSNLVVQSTSYSGTTNSITTVATITLPAGTYKFVQSGTAIRNDTPEMNGAKFIINGQNVFIEQIDTLTFNTTTTLDIYTSTSTVITWRAFRITAIKVG